MENLIDRQALAQLKDFITDRFGEVVEVFVRSSEKYIEAIEVGFAQHDMQMVIDAAHPLKSSSGNLALVVLADLARDIEAQANAVLRGESEMDVSRDNVGKIGEVYRESALLLKAETL